MAGKRKVMGVIQECRRGGCLSSLGDWVRTRIYRRVCDVWPVRRQTLPAAEHTTDPLGR